MQPASSTPDRPTRVSIDAPPCAVEAAIRAARPPALVTTTGAISTFVLIPLYIFFFLLYRDFFRMFLGSKVIWRRFIFFWVLIQPYILLGLPFFLGDKTAKIVLPVYSALLLGAFLILKTRIGDARAPAIPGWTRRGVAEPDVGRAWVRLRSQSICEPEQTRA